MPAVELQFHVAPREAVSLALGWAEEAGLRAVLEHDFPTYRTLEVSVGADIDATTLAGIGRVALLNGMPDLTATTANEFVARNTDVLYLSIGRLTDEGLREAGLGGTTADRDLIARWRVVVRAAKKPMHVGATVRNPHSGAQMHLPRHCHTPGAHDLAARGVPMLAVGGWVEYFFDDIGPS